MNPLQWLINFVRFLTGQDVQPAPSPAPAPAPQPVPQPAPAPIIIPPTPLPTPATTLLSPQGLRLIELFEQCRLTMYQDGKGIWTIGWGHALTSSTGVQLTDKVAAQAAMMKLFGTLTPTQAQVDAQFEIDLTSFEKAVEVACPGVPQGQYDAMVSFAFNCGVGNFGRSSVKRLTLAKQGAPVLPLDLPSLKGYSATPTTIPQAFSEWSNSGGVWVLGLFRRRMAEAMVYAGMDAQTAYTTAEAYRG